MNFEILIDKNDQSEKFYRSPECCTILRKIWEFKSKSFSTTKFSRKNNVSGKFKEKLID